MWLAPSTVAIGKGACSVIARQRLDKSGWCAARDVSSTAITFLLLLRLRFRRAFLFLRLARAGSRGDSCGQPVVVRGSRVDDDDALVRDDIFADVFAVIAAAQFYHNHHFAKLAVNFHITHPDNVIG